MAFVLFQRGATSWGFQVGSLYLYVNYPSYWGRWPWRILTWGIDQDA